MQMDSHCVRGQLYISCAKYKKSFLLRLQDRQPVARWIQKAVVQLEGVSGHRRGDRALLVKDKNATIANLHFTNLEIWVPHRWLNILPLVGE